MHRDLKKVVNLFRAASKNIVTPIIASTLVGAASGALLSWSLDRTLWKGAVVGAVSGTLTASRIISSLGAETSPYGLTSFETILADGLGGMLAGMGTSFLLAQSYSSYYDDSLANNILRIPLAVALATVSTCIIRGLKNTPSTMLAISRAQALGLPPPYDPRDTIADAVIHTHPCILDILPWSPHFIDRLPDSVRLVLAYKIRIPKLSIPKLHVPEIRLPTMLRPRVPQLRRLQPPPHQSIPT